jgi:chromosome segregation ATPase
LGWVHYTTYTRNEKRHLSFAWIMPIKASLLFVLRHAHYSPQLQQQLVARDSQAAELQQQLTAREAQVAELQDAVSDLKEALADLAQLEAAQADAAAARADAEAARQEAAVALRTADDAAQRLAAAEAAAQVVVGHQQGEETKAPDDYALRAQLQAAVDEAVTAAREQLHVALTARDNALAAAEADIAELRTALAGRDERLACLQSGSGAAAAAHCGDDNKNADVQGEVELLKQQLAAAHQRTHEVTQMYLAAANEREVIGSAVDAPCQREAKLTALHPVGLPPLKRQQRLRGMHALYFVAMHAAVGTMVAHSGQAQSLHLRELAL